MTDTSDPCGGRMATQVPRRGVNPPGRGHYLIAQV